MKRAAVFMENYGLGRCSVALCLLDMLAKDYQIDIHVANVWLGQSPILYGPTVRIIDLNSCEGSLASRSVQAIRDARVRRSLRDRLYVATRRLRPAYDLHLTFDPHGFVRCITLFPDARPIHVSLELYFRDNYFNLSYPENVMRRERDNIDRIQGLLIQSPERDQLFRDEYALNPSIPTFFLPITQLEPSVRQKSTYLREHYKIRQDSRILLHLGGIAPQHRCLEMVEAFQRVSGWTLVFHGHAYPDYVDTLKRAIEEYRLGSSVLITDGTFGNLRDVDDIVGSGDAGVCWYDDVSPNFTSAGKSSGKTAAYLRFGLPVITNNYPSSRAAIADPGCGVCIEDLSGLPAALESIERSYAAFSENAIAEYDRTYWFDNYRLNLTEFIVRPRHPPSGDEQRSYSHSPAQT